MNLHVTPVTLFDVSASRAPFDALELVKAARVAQQVSLPPRRERSAVVALKGIYEPTRATCAAFRRPRRSESVRRLSGPRCGCRRRPRVGEKGDLTSENSRKWNTWNSRFR